MKYFTWVIFRDCSNIWLNLKTLSGKFIKLQLHEVRSLISLSTWQRTTPSRRTATRSDNCELGRRAGPAGGISRKAKSHWAISRCKSIFFCFDRNFQKKKKTYFSQNHFEKTWLFKPNTVRLKFFRRFYTFFATFSQVFRKLTEVLARSFEK